MAGVLQTRKTMSSEPIYVTQPSLPPLDEFLPYLRQIWDSRILTNGGPRHRQLEAELREWLGVPHIALFANGTLALSTALKALGVTGEVITTPYTFVATTHALHWNGIEPVFADIDADTLNLDPARIEAAITPRTTAIMPVHCYGTACDTSAIEALARRYGLKVIYDAAHAFGVSDAGGSLLRHGDMSVLSFHATKIFSTFEGGAIVCRDADSLRRLNKMKNFGFVDEVTVDEVGINGKLSEIAAAFGLMQLRHFETGLARRRGLDLAYREALRDVAGIRCLPPDRPESANHGYFPVFVEEAFPMARDELYHELRQAGIHARRYFYPLVSAFPMYAGLPSAADENLPVATKAAARVICLPLYAELAEAQQGRVIEIIRRAGGCR
jgi:dTDP-4-amino-4,6-dideoxygalactose transaminase